MSNLSKFNKLFEGEIEIATLPDIFYQLQDVVDNPCSTFNDIGNVIRTDTNLTARLLSIANTPYYAPSSKIETISHALTILGLNEIKDLAFSTLLVERFKGMSNKVISMRAFWEHSLCCAFASREISDQVNQSQSIDEKIFISGLLHNAGLLFLCLKIPEKVEEVVKHCIETKMPLNDAEWIVLGFDHSLVGERLLQTWGLPLLYQKIARYHHQPTRANHFKLEISIIHLADHYTKSYCVGSTIEPLPPVLDQNSLKITGLTHQQLDDLFKNQIIPKFKSSSGAFLQAA